jgi:hypothetical protein
MCGTATIFTPLPTLACVIACTNLSLAADLFSSFSSACCSVRASSCCCTAWGGGGGEKRAGKRAGTNAGRTHRELGAHPWPSCARTPASAAHTCDGRHCHKHARRFLRASANKDAKQPQTPSFEPQTKQPQTSPTRCVKPRPHPQHAAL